MPSPAGLLSRALRLGQQTGHTIPAYHGTRQDIIGSFDPDMRGAATGSESAKNAFWFAKDPFLANDYALNLPHPQLKKIQEAYNDASNRNDWQMMEALERRWEQMERADAEMPVGANVFPAMLRMENPLVYKPTGGVRETGARGFWSGLLDKTKAGGHDGLIAQSVVDPVTAAGDRLTDIYAVLNPNQIRSMSAKFDPKKRFSPDILAGVGGSSLLLNGLLSEDR